MNFFEKVGKTASKTYKATADKTSKLAKEAKLKILIGDDENKIEDFYIEIGKKIYKMHENKETIGENIELTDIFTKIDSLKEEIKDTKEEILKLKDSKICENCGMKIDIESHYCNNCGYEQEQK